MDWPIWFVALGVVFSLGFHIGYRLGLQEGRFQEGVRGNERHPSIG
jgi:hypothetical protein